MDSRRIRAVAVAALLFACAASPPEFLPAGSPWEPGDFVDSNEFVPVALVTLLADPQPYLGKRVSVDGVAHFHFEGSVLFQSREHYALSLLHDAILIRPDLEALGSSDEELALLNGCYVSLVGEVAEGTTRLGFPAVLLKSVSRIQLLEQPRRLTRRCS